MRWSSRSWWDEPGWGGPSDGRFRVDLAEIMDELEPGWASWTGAPEPAAG